MSWPCLTGLLELSIHHELYLSENRQDQAGSSHSDHKVKAQGFILLNIHIYTYAHTCVCVYLLTENTLESKSDKPQR